MHDQAISIDAHDAEKSTFIYRRQSGLAWLVLKNIVLNAITLFFYRFWARTNWRRHLWSNVVLRGDPFEYTGTGLEMFKGFLIAMAILAPLLIGFEIFYRFVDPGGAIAQFGRWSYLCAISLLWIAAEFYARRYRASRTRWRGVAFALEARYGEYLGIYFKTTFMAAFTFFLMVPHASLKREIWFLQRTRFGDRFFSDGPESNKLLPYWMVVWVSAVVTMVAVGFTAAFIREKNIAGVRGAAVILDTLPSATLAAVAFAVMVIGYLVYRVAMFRLIANSVRIGEVSFVSAARSTRIFLDIAVFGILLMVGVVTLFFVALYFGVEGRPKLSASAGILFSFALISLSFFIYLFLRDVWLRPRIVKHLISTLTVVNAQLLDSIAAGAEQTISRGEGLADSFDVGIG
jgi:uncharacterized membrane protein YjgN (DUF898 family)